MRADLVLQSGHRLVGSPGTTVLAARAGRLVATRLGDLDVADWVALGFDDRIDPPPVHLEFPGLNSAYGNQKSVDVPTHMTTDLALLLGMYASEGHTTSTTYTIVITNSVDSVLATAVELWRRVFGINARITRQPGKCPGVVASSKTVCEIFDALGAGRRASEKRIPHEVLDSPEAVLIAFLRGLALDAYTNINRGAAKWAICLDSPGLLDDLQAALRRLGFLSGRISKYNPRYDKSYDEVFVSGTEAQRLVSRVPFLEPDKAARARALAALPVRPRRNGFDVVPLVRGRELYAEVAKGMPGRSGAGSGVSLRWRHLVDPRTEWPSRYAVEQLSQSGTRLPPDVQRVLDEGLHFSQVRSRS
jgi:hypothetical protein